MSAKLGISELVARVGDDNIVFQNLAECATNFQARKKPSPHTAVTFLTQQITPSEVLSNERRYVCLVVWLPTELVNKARREHDAHDPGEHLAANGKPIDGYPRQEA